MLYFISIPITFGLLVLFLVLTWVEGKSGKRVFAQSRGQFDARVERASFILEHVDWGAFVNDVLRTGIERALHDIAHGTLQVVRLIERGLTRTVRYLRMRRERILPPPTPKAPMLSGTVSYLRRTLHRTQKAPENLPGQEEAPEL